MTAALQRNPNESFPYRVVHATKWSKKSHIERPMRLVVIQLVGKKFDEFAVRWQDKNGSTYGGASFHSKEQAHNAFLEKYLNHNKCYGPKNISHLPGLVK